MAQGKEQKGGGAKQDAGEVAQAEPPRANPMALMKARREAATKKADAYNKAHPDQCVEFNRLTKNKCGSGMNIEVASVRAWQNGHPELIADGMIGPKTLDVARAEAPEEQNAEDGSKEGVESSQGGEKKHDKKQEKGHDKAAAAAPAVNFDDEEAGAMDAGELKQEMKAGQGAGGAGGLADQVAAEGDSSGMEKRAEPNKEQQLEEKKQHGEMMQEAGEHAVEGAGGPELAPGGKVAVRLALLPALIEMLREHRYKEAVQYIVKSVGYEERVEFLKEAVEHLAKHFGYQLAPHVASALKGFVIAGAVADVVALGWEWTYKGFELIREAHEKGDRDSRIAIYAFAWSDTVMGNRHSNPGAVTEEQREAMELGVQDGGATAAASPELAGMLLAEYGEPGNARHALEDALLKRAGFGNVKTHAGK